MQFCVLILNMIFVLNKKRFLLEKNMKYLKNHGFFESLLYGPGTFALTVVREDIWENIMAKFE